MDDFLFGAVNITRGALELSAHIALVLKLFKS